jgi:hypothetical protein
MVFLKLPRDGLEPDGILTGRLAVARSQVSAGFRGQIALFGLQFRDLRDEPLAETGVIGQSLVVLGDLFAEILFLYFKKSLWILPFHAADEQAKEASNEIADAFKHNVPINGICPNLASRAAIARTDYARNERRIGPTGFPDS